MAEVPPLDSSAEKDAVAGVAASTEKALNAPAGSIVSLILNDDWSFVIKSHALIEGAISMMLGGVLDQRLLPIFSKIELGRVDAGKLAFSKALDLTTSAERRFIVELSKLRNILAHDMRYIGFTFDSYLTALDSKQRAAFVESMAMDVAPEKAGEWKAFVAAHPKIGVWGSVLRVLSKATMNIAMMDLKKREQALTEAFAAEVRQAWEQAPAAEDGAGGSTP
jgi:hypothetical protein